MSTVAVIDYGMGNLRSVCKAMRACFSLRRGCKLTNPTRAVIRRADRVVVFPGQGAIGGCMVALEHGDLHEPLLEAMKTKPFLGICLGLQALYDFSEEGGGTPCLSLLAGSVKRFPAEKMTDKATGLPLKVPHMGWNQVHQEKPHPLWRGIAQDSRFYFVHSYYAESAQSGDVTGSTDYGLRFTSAAARANIFAVQFHPEKSQQAGLKLLENFVSWDGTA